MDEHWTSEEQQIEVIRCIGVLGPSIDHAVARARSKGFTDDHVSIALIGLAERYRADVVIRHLTFDDFSLN
jgi:hypothetical protein